jgi:hypothetical protein
MLQVGFARKGRSERSGAPRAVALRVERESAQQALASTLIPRNRLAGVTAKDRSVKDECPYRMIFFGKAALLNAVRNFVLHFHGERNHQGLDNRLIKPGEEVGRMAGEVSCRKRLGGVLRYYYREAA